MNTNRTVLEADLAPLAGSLFQPTGFPDLGAAEFEARRRHQSTLLVESAQSMANWLEATTWDAARAGQDSRTARCRMSACHPRTSASCPRAGWRRTGWPPPTS